MGQSQPFLYDAQRFEDSRFPTATFDPKAITRASWEPKPKKAVPKGPLVSFDLHPEYVCLVANVKIREPLIDIPVSYHVILPHRTDNYTLLDRRAKIYITWLRRLQLVLRILQLNAAIGVLVLFTLFKNVDNTTAWAMRILVRYSLKINLGSCQYRTQLVDLIQFTASGNNRSLCLCHIPSRTRRRG
jgi:hypothetical protein